MTEALRLSIEYVNWMDSELHAIKCRVDNDAELASVVRNLVCQSREEADATLGELFDCGPVKIDLADGQIIHIAGRVEEGLLPFEPAFFGQLEYLGKIRLMSRHRFFILVIAYLSLLERRQHVTELMRPILDQANVLLKRIREFGPATFPIALPIPGLGLADTEPFMLYLEKIANFETELSAYEVSLPRPRGRRRKWRQDALALLLGDLYTEAGGVPKLSLDEDQNRLVGPFAEFLSAIWEALPHNFTEGASAQTFLRTRARDLKYGLRALPQIRCILTAFDQQDRAAGIRRRQIRDAAASLTNSRVDWPTAESELRRRYPDVTEDELLEAIEILFLPYCISYCAEDSLPH